MGGLGLGGGAGVCGRHALAAVLLTVAGCSPRQEKVFPIQSKLFSAVQIIGTRGTGVGELNKPRGVAVDANDNLYVVDMTARVQKFSPEGVHLLTWQMTQTDKGKPKGMCRDHNGNIIVIEPHYSRVNVFSPEGKLVAQWGAKGHQRRAVGNAAGGGGQLARGHLCLRIRRFGARAEVFGGRDETASAAGGGRETGRANSAGRRGWAIDAQDRIYVADSCNHRIQVFSADGQFLRAYGKAGSGAGRIELSLRHPGGRGGAAIRVRIRQQPHPGI